MIMKGPKAESVKLSPLDMSKIIIIFNNKKYNTLVLHYLYTKLYTKFLQCIKNTIFLLNYLFF
jgi:hypothetical protein